jgi:hypothetical protein
MISAIITISTTIANSTINTSNNTPSSSNVSFNALSTLYHILSTFYEHSSTFYQHPSNIYQYSIHILYWHTIDTLSALSALSQKYPGESGVCRLAEIWKKIQAQEIFLFLSSSLSSLFLLKMILFTTSHPIISLFLFVHLCK